MAKTARHPPANRNPNQHVATTSDLWDSLPLDCQPVKTQAVANTQNAERHWRACSLVLWDRFDLQSWTRIGDLNRSGVSAERRILAGVGLAALSRAAATSKFAGSTAAPAVVRCALAPHRPHEETPNGAGVSSARAGRVGASHCTRRGRAPRANTIVPAEPRTLRSTRPERAGMNVSRLRTFHHPGEGPSRSNTFSLCVLRVVRGFNGRI